MAGLRRCILICAGIVLAPQPGRAQDGEVRKTYQVRYVAADAVYLDGGRQGGLAEGYRLTVRRRRPGEAEMAAVDVAEITVIAIAATSAACEIKSKKMDLTVGDIAYLSPEDLETAKVMKVSQDVRKYAQVVSFSEGDPLEEEVRKYVPRPPSPEVNRARGMVSFEHDGLYDHASNSFVNQVGMLLRADVSRIGGSYWNFTGYWRGRFTSYGGHTGVTTLNDLLNRTYHIGFFYNNPESHYTVGFGRLLIPWATSLNTIDGGYFGRRWGKHVTTAIFAGSTPDPTAWNYNPNRQIVGALLNYDAGSYDNMRYSGTAGIAITRLHWLAERQFAFFENSFFFKHNLSIYSDLEVDQFVLGRLGSTGHGIKPSRSFVTVRYQPVRFLTFDLNDNYFRSVPTFDLRLLGTGLLEQYLFRGLSGGVKVDLPHRVSLYGSYGKSSRDTDTQASRNLMYGITLGRIWGGARLDYRHTEFGSSFGKGGYDTFSLTREITDKVRLDMQGGKEELHAIISSQHRTYFLNSDLDWFFSRHYSMGGGWSFYRGETQNYDQIFMRLGYRY